MDVSNIYVCGFVIYYDIISNIVIINKSWCSDMPSMQYKDFLLNVNM